MTAASKNSTGGFVPSGPQSLPRIGALVQVRRRNWLVENVAWPERAGDDALVELACADDDAQGQTLTVLWSHETDARILRTDGWEQIRHDAFDPPDLFGAYFNALRWNTVTSADPTLFQSPFRAGIRVDAYQLEPLRKALALPRVNLFIADDVGLGKTIEAGLIARELLLRHRIDSIVVAAPPSMLHQWQEELEARFGLTFVILDRQYFAEVRKERGYAINPWTTHSRFLVSHNLLTDETYTAGLRDWLSDFRPRSLLILDEAHHAAPSSGSRYAIDSQITRAMRDLAGRFEHRLFLSATPHNGHSNSFSALLELLDPQRFVRGIKVRPGDLAPVMVRRLKDDIRELQGGFPKREVEQCDIDDLPLDAPELVLAEKLDAYRALREVRFANATRAQQRQARLIICTLQQRLLSSIEAFARTVRVHRRAIERALADAQSKSPTLTARAVTRGLQPVGSDDDRATLDGEEQERLGEDALEAATAAAEPRGATGHAIRLELALLDEMISISEAYRDEPDGRVSFLVRWIEHHMCPGVLDSSVAQPPRWNRRRLLIFTEWEDTRRYLERRLRSVVSHTDEAERRLAVFSGSTSPATREELKQVFNQDPDHNPLRILICTDAAREGLNFQRHCYDLFHFDLPWNPSRLEQRNGRIDRKLQPAETVYCRYFFYPQRPEDRILQALVRKNENIRRELGSAGNVLEDRIADLLVQGIRRPDVAAQATEILAAADVERDRTIREELESAVREQRQLSLQVEIDRLRIMVERARQHIGLDADHLRNALTLSLRLAHASSIEPVAPATDRRPALFRFPAEHPTIKGDSGWTPAIDLLREPRTRGERPWEWRNRASVRPLAFEDTGEFGDSAVHLHLEHRLVQRLLARFTTQGLLHFDLARACLATARGSDARVLLIGRLSLFGAGAVRLHDEIIPITARWVEHGARRAPLAPYSDEDHDRTLQLLENSFAAQLASVPDQVQRRLLASVERDIAELRPHLDLRGAEASKNARQRLGQRGRSEASEMRRLLTEQRRRINDARTRSEAPPAFPRGTSPLQSRLDLFTADERRLHEAEERQRQADRRAWERRLSKIDGELESEPARIADSYEVRTSRLEPVGVVYLWPATG